MAMDDMAALGDLGGDDALDDTSEPESMPPAAPLDDFAAEIAVAFPDMSPEQTDALKNAIRICLEEDQGGGYGGSSKKPKESGLALVFGPAKKPKS